MIVSAGLRCIFVHVQKTGGTSIEAVLRNNDAAIGSHMHAGRRHLHAREIRDILPTVQWDGYFKFAFVRNPWDRLVSWYWMCAQATAPNAFATYVQQHARSFDDFVMHPKGMLERTTRNQLDYLVDGNDQVIVDHIGRYETLHDDFANVLQRLNISGKLPHANRSAHRPYRQYYSDTTREIVAQRFARDIEAFDYNF